jgi:hypothetical protein
VGKEPYRRRHGLALVYLVGQVVEELLRLDDPLAAPRAVQRANALKHRFLRQQRPEPVDVVEPGVDDVVLQIMGHLVVAGVLAHRHLGDESVAPFERRDPAALHESRDELGHRLLHTANGTAHKGK